MDDQNMVIDISSDLTVVAQWGNYWVVKFYMSQIKTSTVQPSPRRPWNFTDPDGCVFAEAASLSWTSNATQSEVELIYMIYY